MQSFFFVFVFVLLVGEAVFVSDDFSVLLGSLQPNQPGLSQPVGNETVSEEA